MEALTIPVTIYVLATTNPLVPTTYHTFTRDMSQDYPDVYALVATKTVDVTVGPFEAIDIIGMQVNSLRARKERIAAECHKSQAFIDDQIQQLLCIDHTPIEESDVPF